MKTDGSVFNRTKVRRHSVNLTNKHDVIYSSATTTMSTCSSQAKGLRACSHQASESSHERPITLAGYNFSVIYCWSQAEANLDGDGSKPILKRRLLFLRCSFSHSVNTALVCVCISVFLCYSFIGAIENDLWKIVHSERMQKGTLLTIKTCGSLLCLVKSLPVETCVNTFRIKY